MQYGCLLGNGREDWREKRRQMVQTIWEHEDKTELISVGNVAPAMEVQ